MCVISLKNIAFGYGQDDPVLRDFTMEIPRGRCVVLRGDNGSGKTTLFKILNGLEFPQEGCYRYDGVIIDRDYLKSNSNSKSFHKKVGYLFQNPDGMLFCGRVYDEIAFGPRQMGMSDEQVDERTRDCMQLLGISAIADKAPYHLSGGQKKLVALAAVLALNPDTIILDEPMAGLDRKSSEKVTEILLELKAAGKTIIFASHDDTLPDNLADDIVYIERRIGYNE